MTQELADNIKLLREILPSQSAALAAINQLVELVAEMRPYMWHSQQCDFVTSFTKDCTCLYPQTLTKADALLTKMGGV